MGVDVVDVWEVCKESGICQYKSVVSAGKGEIRTAPHLELSFHRH